jgi:hypothetical protein
MRRFTQNASKCSLYITQSDVVTFKFKSSGTLSRVEWYNQLPTLWRCVASSIRSKQSMKSNEDTRSLRNADYYLPVDTAKHSTKDESSSAQLWDLKPRNIVTLFLSTSRWVLSEWEILQPQHAEKIKTQILCSKTFIRKSCRLWDNVEKNVLETDRLQMTV